MYDILDLLDLSAYYRGIHLTLYNIYMSIILFFRNNKRFYIISRGYYNKDNTTYLQTD